MLTLGALAAFAAGWLAGALASRRWARERVVVAEPAQQPREARPVPARELLARRESKPATARGQQTRAGG